MRFTVVDHVEEKSLALEIIFQTVKLCNQCVGHFLKLCFGRDAARTIPGGSHHEPLCRKVDQVIERLARGGASSGDLSNQAIASIALGSSAPAASRPGEEEQPDTAGLGEETQALINALINQLGGRVP